jgi:hypothetical protein
VRSGDHRRAACKQRILRRAWGFGARYCQLSPKLIKEDVNNEKYFSYGPLFYAKPIEAIELRGRTYFTNFHDLTYKPKDKYHYQFIEDNQATFKNGQILMKAKNKTTQNIENITLIPFGKTILRQVSF